MADVETDPGPGEKEANKPPSPKPDTEGEVAPPLISTKKGTYHSYIHAVIVIVYTVSVLFICIFIVFIFF